MSECFLYRESMCIHNYDDIIKWLELIIEIENESMEIWKRRKFLLFQFWFYTQSWHLIRFIIIHWLKVKVVKCDLKKCYNFVQKVHFHILKELKIKVKYKVIKLSSLISVECIELNIYFSKFAFNSINHFFIFFHVAFLCVVLHYNAFMHTIV